MIDTTVVGSQHESQTDPKLFTIGTIDPSKFYHVFDEENLELILRELDTISDFTTYLQDKEELFRSTSIIAASEQELLAAYLSQLDADGRHTFHTKVGEYGFIAFDEGFWEDYVASPERTRKIKADMPSYLWDRIVESAGLIVPQDQDTVEAATNQRRLVSELMAWEPRTRRRLLSESLIGMMNTYAEELRGARLVFPSREGDPTYLLFGLFKPPEISIEEYRRGRAFFMTLYCMALRQLSPMVHHVIAVGIELGTSLLEQGPPDLVYFDGSVWNEELEVRTKAVRQKYGILLDVGVRAALALEYPVSQESIDGHRKELSGELRPYKISPEARCFCLSGKKYKNCCMKVGKVPYKKNKAMRISNDVDLSDWIATKWKGSVP